MAFKTDREAESPEAWAEKSESRRGHAAADDFDVCRAVADKTIELKPCPGCGHVPGAPPNEFELEDDFVYPATRDRTVWSAHCTAWGTGCGWSVLGSSEREAVEKWNKRADFGSGDC